MTRKAGRPFASSVRPDCLAARGERSFFNREDLSMFGLSSARRPRRPLRRPRRYRKIGFECLENRYCLSAPSITSFQIDSVDGAEVTVSGYVIDEWPEYAEVILDGVLNEVAYPDSTGYFECIGDASGVGTIEAIAIDDEYLWSDPAEVELQSQVPSVTSLQIVYNGKNDITIQGKISDEDPEDATVYIYGAVFEELTPDANGDFSVDITDASLGSIEVYAVDALDQESDTLYDDITSDAPEIVNFSAIVSPGNVLTVEGDVIDEDAAGLTVEITWLDETYEVTVDQFGHFVWIHQLNPGDNGWVSALTFDWWGQESNNPEDLVWAN
jgi:hypothetical protein